MFDIYSKTNKHGDNIVETVNKSIEEINPGIGWQGAKRNKYYKIQKEYSIFLPSLNATINADYNAINYFNWDGPDSSYCIDYLKNTTIKFGKKEFIKGHCERDVKSGGKYVHPDEDLNFNETVSALVAYDYAIKHVKDYVLSGKTKEDLKNLPLEELEKINTKIDNITKSFEDALKETLQHIHVEKIDSQKMLDEAFGEGSVNLDKLVEEQVSQALILREEKTDKKIARDARIEKLHSGVMKMTKPVRLVANKIKTSISSSKENRKKKQEERRTEREEAEKRNELIENIME